MEAFLGGRFTRVEAGSTAGSAATVRAGRAYAASLVPGDVVALSGNLGAGKTHFIKGVISHFGVLQSQVVSPTFGLVREYRGRGMKLYHFDFYRLQSARELEKTGYHHFIREPDAVILAEWPEMIEETWGDFTRAVRIEHAGEKKRKLTYYRAGNAGPATNARAGTSNKRGKKR